MAKKIYNLEITPLTGVHIGTGEELTFLDYLVQNISGKNMYLKFSSDNILDRLINEGVNLSEFYRIADSKNMKKLQEFFHKNVTSKTDIEYPCETTKSFLKVYNSNKTKDPIENAAKVLQMYRPNGKKAPVIPGSSLKGSIRTAVLNDILDRLDTNIWNAEREKFEAEKFKRNKMDLYEKNMQKKLLKYSDLKADPFRTVLLEDVSFPVRNTQIVGLLKNISASKDELFSIDKLQIQAEIIKGALLGGDAIANSKLIIDETLQNSKVVDNKKNFEFGKHISIETIVEACNWFFMQEFNDEYEKFYENSVEYVDIITKLKGILNKAVDEKNTFIFRVGRWSQVEFMTFEDSFRDIKVPVRGGKPQSYGKTRTVFDYDGNYIPMGWCKCTYKEV